MNEKKKDLERAMLWMCNMSVLFGRTGLMLISLMFGLWETVSSGRNSSLTCCKYSSLRGSSHKDFTYSDVTVICRNTDIFFVYIIKVILHVSFEEF